MTVHPKQIAIATLTIARVNREHPQTYNSLMGSQRFASIDIFRGAAIVWMTLFHFSFDLNHFGYLRQNFYTDPFWTLQRILIVSLFLLAAGMGQAVAMHQSPRQSRFYKRWLQIAACALAVTLGSYWMYPKSFISFGVLHGIALMLLIVRFSASWGRWLWLLGGCAIAISFIATYIHLYWPSVDFLNDRSFNWLGLVSRKPVAEDYVPLFPWLGVMWWGVAGGQYLLANRRTWLEASPHAWTSPLAWLGRNSLAWYMLHQPVLIGLFMVLAALL